MQGALFSGRKGCWWWQNLLGLGPYSVAVPGRDRDTFTYAFSWADFNKVSVTQISACELLCPRGDGQRWPRRRGVVVPMEPWAGVASISALPSSPWASWRRRHGCQTSLQCEKGLCMSPSVLLPMENCLNPTGIKSSLHWLWAFFFFHISILQFWLIPLLPGVSPLTF